LIKRNVSFTSTEFYYLKLSPNSINGDR